MVVGTLSRVMWSALSVADGSEAPLPTEFCLFAAGLNKTQKGDFVFDAEAAQTVMAAYQRDGVDMMIDLEHDSLNPDARLLRSDAADAMGWFTPELRNGELWATQVRWSAEGERRLRGKLQRYISPAATFNTKTMRVGVLINAALCARPATYDAAPLVAASRSILRLGAGGSQNEISNAIAGALTKMFPPVPPADCRSVWVVDLYDDRVIYELDGVLYSVAYSYASGVATIVGESTRVVRTYAPVAVAVAARGAVPRIDLAARVRAATILSTYQKVHASKGK